MRLRRALLPSLILFLALYPAACSDSTAPGSDAPPDGGAVFDGAFDGESFVLKRIDASLVGQQPVFIELIGSNVQLDETNETVSVDVALRNVGPETLYAPATVWLNHFLPTGVAPLNADFVSRGEDSTANALGSYGYDYTEQLGEDASLGANENSESKTWVLQDPGLLSFSFSARAIFGMEPGRPVISGYVFSDENRNGIRERNELPYRAGGITVEFPDGSVMSVEIAESGAYRVPVKQTGLHTVRFASFLECVACWCETTPNPLEVMITPGPDGEPRSFTQAHFGIYPGPCFDPPTRPIPPVVLTDTPPEEIDQDPYRLLGSGLSGELLRLRVGYSGCSEEHPFTLYSSPGFMESLPVQTWMLLAHDDLDEPCDAWFERTLYFDLAPIQDAYIEGYGEPGVVKIRFLDFAGEETVFTLEPNFVTLRGTVTRIDDAVAVDGGVVIDLQLENGETAQLHFATMYTWFPQAPWRGELYQLITRLVIGDQVEAMGRPLEAGIELRQLEILD